MQNYDTHYLNPMPTKRQLKVLDACDRLDSMKARQRELLAVDEDDMTDEEVREFNRLHHDIRDIYTTLDGQ